MVPTISRAVQRRFGSKSMVAGRVARDQVRRRYAASCITKAVYLERINCSAVDAVALPWWSGPQQPAYGVL
ncbi:hypothetical protein GCM10010530_51650 [Kribbella aluminosa]